MFLDTLLSLDLPRRVIILAISTLPIFELRVSLPVAINLFNFPWPEALLLAIIGNMLPVPVLLLFWNALYRLLARISILKRPLNWIYCHTRQRSKIVAKYGQIGLLLFVAIPLPMTGAWTGSFIAVLLGFRLLPALLYIFIGVCIAGAIVTCLSFLDWAGAVLAGLVLTGLAIFTHWKT